jgi:hypothetical protein
VILLGICLVTGGGMAGCGSSSATAGTVVPGTYTFTITATGAGNTTGNVSGAVMTATLVVEK